MKTILKILIIISLTLSILSANRHYKYSPMNYTHLYNSMKHLSKQQKRVIRDIKRYAPKNLRVVLLAIAWQESSFGYYRVLRDKRDWRKSSYGIFHATLLTTKYNLKRSGRDLSYKRIRQLLLYNTKFNIRQAVKNIRYWYNYRYRHLKNKRYVLAQALACYNGGYKGYKRRLPKSYSKLVRLKMKVIKRLLREHII